MFVTYTPSTRQLRTPPRDGALRKFHTPLQPDQLPYYHGVLSQEGAESRLDKKGDFLLRRDTPDEALVLSVNVDKGIFHHQVLIKEEGVYRLPRKPYVNTEEEYINYFYEYKFPILDDVFLLSPIQPHHHHHQQSSSNEAIKTPPREGNLLIFGKERPIEQLPYYHGLLGRMETENLLKNDGDFLLRRDPPDQAVVLSVRARGGQKHHLVVEPQDGVYKLPAEPHVKTVEEYINYFNVYAMPIVPGAFLENPIDSNKF